MKVFLAGGVSGNIHFFWEQASMQIYLAGVESRPFVFDEFMKVYLADTNLKYAYCQDQMREQNPYILESFFYSDKTTEKAIPMFGDFLLDSGAFTFRQSNKSNIVWEEYIERYADFINRNKVDKFFELDIDSLVGYEKVLEYRKYLEKLTRKQCIPVWHINRGKEEFIKSCIDYNYVALGGIAGLAKGCEAYRRYQSKFPWFIGIAHKNNAKIHGLGFTALEKLKEYHFDSVDSTAWTTGNRYGYAYKFENNTMVKYEIPKGKKIADPRQLAINNFNEWMKFQRYADNHL